VCSVHGRTLQKRARPPTDQGAKHRIIRVVGRAAGSSCNLMKDGLAFSLFQATPHHFRGRGAQLSLPHHRSPTACGRERGMWAIEVQT